MTGDLNFNPPPWTGESQLISELWQLRKRGRKAVCTLWNHPDGAELRLEVEGRGTRTFAGRDIEQLLEISTEWHNGLIAAVGWVEGEW